MMIPLKNYDLAAAKQRMHDLIAQQNGFERGLAFGPDGYDEHGTESIRSLGNDGLPACSSALVGLESNVLSSLINLPYTEGGTARPVGETSVWSAVLDDLHLDLPLVRALLVLRGHPCHGGFKHVDFRRARGIRNDGTLPAHVPFEPGGPDDAGPILEQLFAEEPQAWSYEAFQALVFESACRAFGDEEIDPNWLPEQIYPGSRVGEYTFILHKLMLYDVFGALDPAFTRQDALVGEWWLIQPVSPRLRMSSLAAKFGLSYAGYLPRRSLDAPGRVVLACFEEAGWDEKRRTTMLDDSKWVAGYQKVLWSKGHPPLSETSFDLVNEYDPETGHLLGVTEDSYGPFTHSSELPPWPGP